MSNEPVDVLIIGAGASGAAVAWSLADTRMRILCLEQGDWVNPATYPSAGPGYENRQDFAIRPNDRRLDVDYPIDDDDSPVKVVNFNGVGGGYYFVYGALPAFSPIGLSDPLP